MVAVKGIPTTAALRLDAQLSRQVRLPELTRVNLQRRETAAAVAEGIDAFDEAEVQYLAALLRRMAHDGDLPGAMSCRYGRQGDPSHAAPELLVQRSVGFAVGVDKDMPHRLVVI